MGEQVAEMWKWIKISFVVATPVCVLSVAKDVFFVDHVHRPHGPLPDYMAVQVSATRRTPALSTSPRFSQYFTVLIFSTTRPHPCPSAR